ncbi:hypothetical protein GQ457_13G000710 [Hibiscus cannabinus]
MPNSMFLSKPKRKSPLSFPKPKSFPTTSWKCYQKRQRLKRLNSGMKRARSGTEEISEEQEKQTQLSNRFEAIGKQCEQLRKETAVIVQQSARTQIRLALMFQILKARENHDFDKAAVLTAALREAIAREEQEMNASEK